jgi:hypothetical protein
MVPEKESPMTEEEMTAELAEQGHPEQEIADRQGVKGKEQRDAQGRVILSDEHYENGSSQIVQIEHGEPTEATEGLAPSKEFGKLTELSAEGERKEKMLVREHPRTKHSFTVKGVTPEGKHVDAFVHATLENLGSTVGEKRDPWSHFIMEGSEVAKLFKGIKPPKGKNSLGLEGQFGSLQVTVDGREIDFKTFSKISLDFDDEGKATKATIHCRDWEEIL